jgi:hypothetical protein
VIVLAAGVLAGLYLWRDALTLPRATAMPTPITTQEAAIPTQTSQVGEVASAQEKALLTLTVSAPTPTPTLQEKQAASEEVASLPQPTPTSRLARREPRGSRFKAFIAPPRAELKAAPRPDAKTVAQVRGGQMLEMVGSGRGGTHRTPQQLLSRCGFGSLPQEGGPSDPARS